jgi:hypothetical protein
MKRRWIASLVSSAVVLSLSLGSAARGGVERDASTTAPAVPRIMIQGKYTTWENQPFIDSTTNRTLLPMRELADKLGLGIEWDGDRRRIWVNDGSQHLLGFTVDSTYMTYDGQYAVIDQPPVIKDGRAYLPARSLVERLGGYVAWQPEYGRIAIGYGIPLVGLASLQLSRQQSCATHGFGDYPYNGGDCPAGVFYFPEVYSAFGFNTVKEAIIGGANLEPAYVAQMNKIAAMHDGKAPKTVSQAMSATVDQLVIDIATAELIGMVWRPANEAEGSGQRGVVASAFTPPKQSGWGFPEGGQSMSEDAIAFQARVSGKPYTLVKMGRGNVHTWEIEEYGYMGKTRGVWFDSFKDDTLIDAKTIPQKWLSKSGQFTDFHASRSAEGIVERARDQISEVGGEFKIQWQIDSQAGLDAWLQWLHDHQAWDVLEHIEFTLGPK